MFLIGAIKPIAEKKLKTCFIFTRLFRGWQSGEYEIKPVLLLYADRVDGSNKNFFQKKGENKF